MNGRPEDVVGECNAHLYIGDDYGDNEATMRCQLPLEHEGNHQEKFMDVVVTWKMDRKENAQT